MSYILRNEGLQDTFYEIGNGLLLIENIMTECKAWNTNTNMNLMFAQSCVSIACLSNYFINNGLNKAFHIFQLITLSNAVPGMLKKTQIKI